jgi:transcriptional regulator with XRE-family HTH domain
MDANTHRQLADLFRTRRKEQGLTLQNVAHAINRSVSYVSDVERAQRGARMPAFLAVLWAQYLNIDPDRALCLLGYADSAVNVEPVRQYLETHVWAVKVQGARQTIAAAQESADELWRQTRPGSPQRQLATELRDACRNVRALLRIPRSVEAATHAG